MWFARVNIHLPTHVGDAVSARLLPFLPLMQPNTTERRSSSKALLALHLPPSRLHLHVAAGTTNYSSLEQFASARLTLTHPTPTQPSTT
jgi:hypothetical protein